MKPQPEKELWFDEGLMASLGIDEDIWRARLAYYKANPRYSADRVRESEQ